MNHNPDNKSQGMNKAYWITFLYGAGLMKHKKLSMFRLSVLVCFLFLGWIGYACSPPEDLPKGPCKTDADCAGSLTCDKGTCVIPAQEKPVQEKQGEVQSEEKTETSQEPAIEPVAEPVAPQQTAPEPTKTQSTPATPKPEVKETPVVVSGGDEIIEMTRMGKLVAKHMVDSVQTSAHVQSFIEADVTNIWNWRNKHKNDFKKREGENLTFTPIFMEAVAKALRDYPMMNISVQGDSIIKKKNINLGMAAALGDGNLIVPVIKNADQLNLIGMAKQVNDLANRARLNQLKPDDIQGGTYTVTNVGTFGSIMGTPIINQPQVGILALGAIRKVPAVIETSEGDFIGIRYRMFMSHSYDHRVVNGALGGQFVKTVKEYLEAWDLDREI